MNQAIARAQQTPPAAPRPVHTPARRRTVLLGAGVAAIALLGGCGFKLRQAPQLPFRTLALSGFKPTSPMADALRRTLRMDASVQVLSDSAQAQVILDAQADSRDKTVMASTSAALVREIQLRARLVFTLRTPAGKVLIPPSEIILTRDLSYNEKDALAKDLEEQTLYRAMHEDMALQVLHRLAAVREL